MSFEVHKFVVDSMQLKEIYARADLTLRNEQNENDEPSNVKCTAKQCILWCDETTERWSDETNDDVLLIKCTNRKWKTKSFCCHRPAKINRDRARAISKRQRRQNIKQNSVQNILIFKSMQYSAHCGERKQMFFTRDCGRGYGDTLSNHVVKRKSHRGCASWTSWYRTFRAQTIRYG